MHFSVKNIWTEASKYSKSEKICSLMINDIAIFYIRVSIYQIMKVNQRSVFGGLQIWHNYYANCIVVILLYLTGLHFDYLIIVLSDSVDTKYIFLKS